MSWPASIFVGILSGVLGLVCTGGISMLCVEWYRITSREGAAGYFVVFNALLGGVLSVIIGLIAARMMAAGAEPGFLKELGVALGTILAIALVALALCRVCADLAPTMGGKDLEVEIEVRCPRGFKIPPSDYFGAMAEVYLSGGRRQPFGKLRLDDVKTA